MFIGQFIESKGTAADFEAMQHELRAQWESDDWLGRVAVVDLLVDAAMMRS